MAYTMLVRGSEKWGVAEGTSCVVSGINLPMLMTSLGGSLGLSVSQMEYLDTDFDEWCRLEQVSELPGPGVPIHVRLLEAQRSGMAAVPQPRRM